MALTEINSLGLKDAEVKTADIADDAVTAAKLADNAVVTDAINADAITAAKIADDAVGAEHIETLDSDLFLGDNCSVVVGAGSGYSVGASGGSAIATLVSHSHTVNNHTHSFSGSGSQSHTHGFQGVFGNDHNDSERNAVVMRNDSNTMYTSHSGSGVQSATVSISISGNTGGSTPSTNAQGASATNANLPPYYALCYIMKT